MNPRVTGNDHDEITVTLGGRELRGYAYGNEAERRVRMLLARDYVEGWCDGRDVLLYAAKDAEDGIREAVRVLDLMGRGQAARDLAVYGNNLRAAIAKAKGEDADADPEPASPENSLP